MNRLHDVGIERDITCLQILFAKEYFECKHLSAHSISIYSIYGVVTYLCSRGMAPASSICLRPKRRVLANGGGANFHIGLQLHKCHVPLNEILLLKKLRAMVFDSVFGPNLHKVLCVMV